MPGHRKRVKHFHEPGDCHELSFSCYRRLPLLTNDAWRSLLTVSMDRAVGRHDFRLIAFVFMPEHVHLLVYCQHVESYCVKNGEPTTEQSNTLQTFHPVWQLYGRP